VTWKVLLGFLNEAEGTEYITRQGVQLSEAELREVQDKARAARDYVKKLTQRGNIKPEVSELPPTADEHLSPLRAEPIFQEHLAGILDWQFAMIEVEKLISYQTNLNMEFIEDLKKRVPQPSDLDALLRFCLPSRKEQTLEPVLVNFNPQTNTYSVITDNLDFRITGTINGEDPMTGRKFVGFAFGGGLRQMSVAEHKGRYFLKNGYHRAFALMLAGHKRIPVVLVHAPSYELTGANRPGFFPVDTLMGNKPPMVGDFGTKAAVDVVRLKLKLIVTVHGEVQAIPV
jgi:hypothetical protein